MKKTTKLKKNICALIFICISFSCFGQSIDQTEDVIQVFKDFKFSLPKPQKENWNDAKYLNPILNIEPTKWVDRLLHEYIFAINRNPDLRQENCRISVIKQENQLDHITVLQHRGDNCCYPSGNKYNFFDKLKIEKQDEIVITFETEISKLKINPTIQATIKASFNDSIVRKLDQIISKSMEFQYVVFPLQNSDYSKAGLEDIILHYGASRNLVAFRDSSKEMVVGFAGILLKKFTFTNESTINFNGILTSIIQANTDLAINDTLTNSMPDISAKLQLKWERKIKKIREKYMGYDNGDHYKFFPFQLQVVKYDGF